MKKLILFLLLPLIAMPALSQSKYYIYHLIYASHVEGTPSNVHAFVDDGEKRYFLKDEKDKTVIFRTSAAVLMYFESMGWEILHINDSYKGIAVDDLTSFLPEPCVLWAVIRKPCTKEELDDVVSRGAYQPPVPLTVRKKRN